MSPMHHTQHTQIPLAESGRECLSVAVATAHRLRGVLCKAKLTDWCGQRRWTVCDDDDSDDMVGGDDDDDENENGDHGVFDDDVQSIISMMM